MEFVLTETKNRIASITLNRPEKRNALNAQFVNELKTAFNDVYHNADVKVILLKANGKAFCAGADLEYLQQLQKNTYQENLDDSTSLMELYKLIYTCPKLVIAQVEGHAIAGGCGLITVCDYVIATRDSKFGYTETKIGFVPAIVMTFLIRKLGEAKARKLLLKGDLISAVAAQNIGLIYKYAFPETIESAVAKLCREVIDENSSDSLAMTKKMIAKIQEMDLDSALSYAAQMNAKARETEDCKNGIKAFLKKETMKW